MVGIVLVLLAAALVAWLVLRRRPVRQLLASFAIGPSDMWALIGGGKTDARLSRLRRDVGDRAAFEAIYAEEGDPWRLIDPGNRYQERKYRGVLSFLPDRRFARALDLGCGPGGFARRLAARADSVLGVDLAEGAVALARQAHADVPNLGFAQGDVLDLPPAYDGQFDLVTLVDILYYAPDTSEEAFGAIAARLARLLRPGGLCLVANHYLIADPPTRLTRRIRAAFGRMPAWRLVAWRWRPFFLALLFAAPDAP